MRIVLFEIADRTHRIEPHSLREVAGEACVHGFDLEDRTHKEFLLRDIRNWRRDGEPGPMGAHGVLTEADQKVLAEVTGRVGENAPKVQQEARREVVDGQIVIRPGLMSIREEEDKGDA